MDERRKDQQPIFERISRRLVELRNYILPFLLVVGQTSLSVVLPLWIDSGKSDEWKSRSNINNNTKDDGPFMDDFFILSFSSFIFFVIFGISFAIKNLNVFLTAGQRVDRRISHKLVVLNGFLGAVSAVLIVFSSSGKRTAPYLQAILINITIPTTLLLR